MNSIGEDASRFNSPAASFADLKIEQDTAIVVTKMTFPIEKADTRRNKDECLLLAPVDGGRAAWMFIIGAVIVDAVIWGFPLNFGVFQNYYMTNAPFRDNRYISMISTFATGLAYLGGPIMTPITIRLHPYRQYLVTAGATACVLGNIGASFATNVWVLVLCQGVIYGIGFLIISYSVFSMLNEWFIRRRGLAYGILLSAAGIGGLGLPFLLQTLLDGYGYAMTLRIYSVATVVIVGPAIILLLRSRTRHMAVAPTAERINYSVLKKPIFSLLSTCNVLQGLVFYLPEIFIPSFATDLELTATDRSILLALLNLAQIIGLLTVGHVSDFIDIHHLLFGSSLGSAVVVYACWGMSKTMLDLCIFSLLYGYLAGSFESLFPRFATALTDNPAAELTFYGFFEFERGLGMVLAGPISSGLLGTVVDSRSYGLLKYQNIILFVGSAFLVGSLAGVGWFFRGRNWYK